MRTAAGILGAMAVVPGMPLFFATATVLGGPPECPQRPFCQPGLETTYNLKVGEFSSLDAGGPQTKTALTSGAISIGLVFSSDGALAA